jgi:small-conductance mechanosensitive channel
VIKTLKPLLEGAYEQSENPARRLLGQTINFAVTALIGLGAWWVCSAIALPLAATASIVVLALALAYTLGGKVWDSDAGNYLSGSVFALATGFTATYGYHHFGWLGGNFAADTVGVVTAVTSFCLVYPLFLLGYQRVFNGAITAAVSGWLVSAHEALWKPFDKLVDQCGEVYYSGYRQDGDFNKLVLHLFNGLVAIALPVAGFFGLHHFVMAHYIVSSIAAVLVVLFSYVVGGRYILRGGVELVGGVVGLGTAIAVGVLVSSLQTLGWWLAGPLAVVCGSLVFCLLFPALFIGARYVCDPTVTKCLLPILAGLYDRAWARFGKVWLGFVAVYHAVVEFLKPYWNGFTTRCSNAWASVMAAWHGMFGR